MKPVSFDATTAECLLFTYKAGLLSRVAHDLKLRVERFEIAVDDQGIHARFDASSLRVVCARAGGKDDLRALSERDRREIEATIAQDVLDARRHPAIDFRSSTVAATVAPAEMQIDGTLSIRGRERPLSLLARPAHQARRRGDDDCSVAGLTVAGVKARRPPRRPASSCVARSRAGRRERQRRRERRGAAQRSRRRAKAGWSASSATSIPR